MRRFITRFILSALVVLSFLVAHKVYPSGLMKNEGPFVIICVNVNVCGNINESPKPPKPPDKRKSRTRRRA
jgi:hypothetical protein